MKLRLGLLIVLLCSLLPLSTSQAQGDTIIPIAYGQSVQGEIKNAKDVLLYAFAGQKGDKVTIKVTALSSGFQPGVILTDKNAKTLANGIKAPIEGFELPAAAVYIIVVGSLRGTGQLSLSLENVSAPVENTPEPGGSIEFGPEEESQGVPILFSSDCEGNWDIYAVNPDGSSRQRLTTGVNPKYSPSWSPDGTKIAYRVEANGKALIYVMDADGSNARQVTKGNYNDFAAAWSPDGTRFAVASGTAWDANDIYVMNVDGSNRKLIAKTNNTARFPSWSPDGQQIIYTKYDGNVSNIYTVSASGRAAKILVKDSADGRWSPDGKTLALANGDLYLMKNGKFIQLTKTPDAEWRPVWSPDGQQIAFMRSSDGGNTWQIFVISADGSNEVEVSPAEGSNVDVWWSPK